MKPLNQQYPIATESEVLRVEANLDGRPNQCVCAAGVCTSTVYDRAGQRVTGTWVWGRTPPQERPFPPPQMAAVEICCGSTTPFAKEAPKLGMRVALAVDICPITTQEARQAIPPDGPVTPPEVREYDVTDMRR